VVITAIYAGSFDPITRGHEDLIRRSCEFVDHLVVAVAVNSSKKALFTTEERVELIRAATSKNKHVEVTQFEGLLVDFNDLQRGEHAEQVAVADALLGDCLLLAAGGT
jgi:pantetheine-phosphate adenylyltransferase